MSNISIPRWAGRAFIALLAIAFLLVVFRLGSQASAGVALNDPVVWVEDGARGRLLQINGSTREITAQVEVGDDGDSIVAFPRGRDAVFLNRTQGVIGVVGSVSLAVDSQDDQPLQSGVMGEQVQLLANHQAAEWTNAYVLDSARTLVFEPGRSQSLEIAIPEEQGLGDSVVDADGRLVVITGDSTQVGVSTELGDIVRLAELPPLISADAEVPSLVRAGDSVYLVDSARRVINELLGNNELGPTVSICGSPSEVQSAGNSLTSTDGAHRILVHDGAAGTLSVSEPAESDCVTIPIDQTGENWGEPVAIDSTAYLPNFDTGQIVIVNLEDRVVTDTFQFRQGNGVPFELEIFDGAVWANEPNGFRAAIVTADELEIISKLGNFVVGEGGAEGEGDREAFARGEGDDSQRAFDPDGPAFAVPDDDGDSQNAELPDGQTVETDEDLDDGDEVDDVENVDEVDDQVDPADLDEDVDVDVPQGPVDVFELPEEAVGVDPVEIEEDEPEVQELEEIIELEETEPVVEPDVLLANFTFSPGDTLSVGDPVQLTDTSVGSPTSWIWEFDDGTGASGPVVNKVWDAPGLYTVTLRVADAQGEISTQTHDFSVVAEDVLRVPSAGFTLSNDIVEVGEQISFTSTSTGEPTALLWDFGDGQTNAGASVNHRFSEPGVYTVTLTASNDAGPNSVTAQITVVADVAPPVAVIGSFPRVVEVGQTVTLVSESTNSPTSVSWDFGEGSNDSGDRVRFAWDTPGEYQIELTVDNSAGSDTTVEDIVVEARVNPPIAEFGESALTAIQGQPITFNDQSLNAPTSWVWDFGDGSTDTGANVTHSWAAPGTYTVTLTVRNGAGPSEISKTVTIDPIPVGPPTAAFTASALTVPVNALITFTNTSTDDPTEFSWNFGDDSPLAAATNPTHSFAAPDTYVVTLTASNDGGSDSATRTITVIDPPTASFTAESTGLDVAFTDTSTRGPTEWAWDFGDGNTSTLQNPTHTYATAGSFPVTLETSNNSGVSIPFATTVTVAEPPVASFSAITSGLTAQFTNTSTGGPGTTYEWDFDGEGASTRRIPTPFTFPATGDYDVTLTVTNGEGTHTTTETVSVTLAPPVAVATCTALGGGVSCDGSTSTSATTFSWSAPGAISMSGTTTPTPSFTFPATGSFPITLTVTNADGAADTDTVTIPVTVPLPPTITGIATSSNANGTVVLSASATESPTSWNWSTPGGTITAGATTATPTVVYTTSGPKTVTATATNATGTSAPDSATFTTALAAPPVITAVNATDNGGGIIALDAVVSNLPVTYAWTTSGGTLDSATAAMPTLTVTANGSYTIGLTVTNPDGSDAGSTSVTITDIVPPVPVVSVTVGAESPAGTVAVSATATNAPILTWTWDVPTAVSSTGTAGPNATFSFPQSPTDVTYTGVVEATNAGGTSTPHTFQIAIPGIALPPPNPTAGFTFAPGATPTTLDFTFTGTSTSPATITWNFPVGTPTATGPAVSHDFGGSGVFSVTVTVTDAGGTDTISLSVTVP